MRSLILTAVYERLPRSIEASQGFKQCSQPNSSPHMMPPSWHLVFPTPKSSELSLHLKRLLRTWLLMHRSRHRGGSGRGVSHRPSVRRGGGAEPAVGRGAEIEGAAGGFPGAELRCVGGPGVWLSIALRYKPILISEGFSVSLQKNVRCNPLIQCQWRENAHISSRDLGGRAALYWRPR